VGQAQVGVRSLAKNLRYRTADRAEAEEGHVAHWNVVGRDITFGRTCHRSIIAEGEWRLLDLVPDSSQDAAQARIGRIILMTEGGDSRAIDLLPVAVLINLRRLGTRIIKCFPAALRKYFRAMGFARSMRFVGLRPERYRDGHN